ncbi:MAG: UDP-N-acetylglucosamine 1-carboxyvinyltransferase [Oscillospiraceae bacterium]|nr:UDP-N-acetylglucosamine 1-carboxyvinyltransferase [Oscillospiraceae bacterium]
MPVWKVRGGRPLSGTVKVQGSKNAVLPIMAASILGGGISCLKGCPDLSDVDASAQILRHLGCSVERSGDAITIDSTPMRYCHIPHELMLKMRSSVMFMGAILARKGEVRLSTPGGCELGSRPIDLHLKALKALGAEISEEGGEVCCRAERLRGANIYLEFPSVGATENTMLAACAAEGETVITNAACEPEIEDLQSFLIKKGADIEGAGTPIIKVHGFTPRERVVHRIMPDRIAASTYLCAAASAGGELLLENAEPQHFSTVIAALKNMGCGIISGSDYVRIRCFGDLRAGKPIITKPYPGFPTDAQALLMASCLAADGTSVFVENIFENRYRHVPELRRFGGDIRTEGRVAMVTGVGRLKAAPVTATDLRGGAAMIIAALAAEGETLIYDSGHIERGYENIDYCLASLGADIQKNWFLSF